VVRRLLTIGLPVLLLVVAFITWKVVGRSLSPVEAMRAEVDRISSSELQRRVPEPGGSDEISRLAATMNRMLARLEASQARQRRFVSDASHELRSPVASIRQNAEVALAHPEMTDTRGLAETVLAESLRVQRLVEDLLLLANADERRAPRADKEVDLDDLVFEEAALVRNGGKVKVDTEGVGAGRVRGDALQLRRAVGNLAENAARHAGSQVSFSLSENDGYVVLRVDDDGPGIPAEQRERVFERFVRLDQARDREGGGSGLGLAIVAEIVAAHGGTVTAGQSPLGGARIELFLPNLSE
jgi:signal transduction histidine kinase